MLSESASVGAKVLGKLAGTEIVDKSISEVNKKTHQTRNDISYADKQIGKSTYPLRNTSTLTGSTLNLK